MVAVLTRLFGFANIEQAEDIVHDTIVKALETWKFNRIPVNPQAWLYRVAKNMAIDMIRRQKLKHKIEHNILLQSEYTLAPTINELFEEAEIKDSQLRMMYACCHPSIPLEAEITLILKTLCGLSAKEISNAFLSNEETINKRLYRTKEKIRKDNISLDYPANPEIKQRTDAVLRALYLLFNEGYNSSHPERLIREDLCEEAMRLVLLLTEEPKTNLPETNALLALMCYQVSRFNSRVDDKGYIVLLKDQDRTQWNTFMIKKGDEYLEKAASGALIHPYHIEAAIASVHANAPTYEATNWQLILNLYNNLLTATGSPVVALNRSLAISEVNGPQAAIDELLQLKNMENSCYYNATMGELYAQSGNKPAAVQHLRKAQLLTTSTAEQHLLRKKITLLADKD
jgi:RNA polymerase sigma-70 factor (ECF subfamily)